MRSAVSVRGSGCGIAGIFFQAAATDNTSFITLGVITVNPPKSIGHYLATVSFIDNNTESVKETQPTVTQRVSRRAISSVKRCQRECQRDTVFLTGVSLKPPEVVIDVLSARYHRLKCQAWEKSPLHRLSLTGLWKIPLPHFYLHSIFLTVEMLTLT